MSFWDASAIVALLVDEPRSKRARAAAAQDSDMTIWWGTRVEFTSALHRRQRDSTISIEQAKKIATRYLTLAASLNEVQPTVEVQNRACELLRLHDLRAADALQLAAAIICSPTDRSAYSFVCFDARLNLAAYREGFVVIPDV